MSAQDTTHFPAPPSATITDYVLHRWMNHHGPLELCVLCAEFFREDAHAFP